MINIKEVKLIDVCKDIFAGGDVPKNVYSVPIYTNGEHNNGLYGFTTKARVSEPSITVSARGTIGFTAIRTIPFYPAIRLITLTPNERIDIKYLYYVTKNYKFDNGGTSIPQLTVPMLKNYAFPLPDLETQRQIAANLDKVTHTIDLCNAILEKLDLLVKSRFVEMFGEPILNPKGWNMATIGDIVTEVKYGTSKPAVDGGKYPYLRMNNLTYDGHLDLTDLKRIDIPDNEIEKCIVRKGDVLFNRTNSVELVGKTCVFDEDEDMIIAGYIIRVRLKPVMLPIVLSCFMNTDALKKKLRNMAKGAVNQANINAQELQAINIYLPPLAIQEQFATFVEQTDKSKLAVNQVLEKAETLKKALMQEYFG